MKQYIDIAAPSLAKALAHPMRTRILATLEDRTASPSEIAKELGASLGVVSYHVRRLHSLGFVKLVESVPRRGAVEHYYTAVAGPRITNAGWAATPAIVKRATVAAALGEISTEVNQAANSGGFDQAQAQAHLSRSPVTVDLQGWKAIARELDALLPRIAKIEAGSHKRLMRSDHQRGQKATVVLMLFTSSGAPEPREPPTQATTCRRGGRARSRTTA